MKFTKEKEEQLTKLMKEYNASDLSELMDILPDLVLEDEDEDELPQQEGANLYEVAQLKETAVRRNEDVSCPFSM